MESMVEIESLMRKTIEDNTKSTILLKPAGPAVDDADVLGSRLGGCSYWSPNKEQVVGNMGQPLYPLIQVDFAAVNGDRYLADFPSSGLLQVFIEDDSLAGSENGEWKLRFFDTGDLPSKSSDSDVVRLPSPKHLGEIFENPNVAYRLEASKIKTLPRGIEESMIDAVNASETDFETLRQTAAKVISESVATFNDGEIHIGGHPYFTQTDPRNDDGYYVFDDGRRKHLDSVLLQIDSDYETIHWGDSGICNLLVDSSDLRQNDFSHVLYMWDCL